MDVHFLISRMDDLDLTMDLQKEKENTNAINVITHDTAIIIECWMRSLDKLETHRLQVCAHSYPSKNTHELYGDIIMEIVKRPVSLIEVVPYIDEYLQFYMNKCQIK